MRAPVIFVDFGENLPLIKVFGPYIPMNSSASDHATRHARHVAIIMDGNGRWAGQQDLPRIEGHRQGVENARAIVRGARTLDIDYLTLFAFSCENWQRPQAEVDALMGLLVEFLRNYRYELLENETRFQVIGRVHELYPEVQSEIAQTIVATQHFQKYTLSLALNYGSRTEMVDAVQAYVKAVQTGEEDPDLLEWSTLRRYLYTGEQPDPDLVIRTSGETRVSNYLLMQSAYAEYYFSPKFWPDFSLDDLKDALEHYRKRERRFGKTGEQIRSEAQFPFPLV